MHAVLSRRLKLLALQWSLAHLSPAWKIRVAQTESHSVLDTKTVTFFSSLVRMSALISLNRSSHMSTLIIILRGPLHAPQPAAPHSLRSAMPVAELSATSAAAPSSPHRLHPVSPSPLRHAERLVRPSQPHGRSLPGHPPPPGRHPPPRCHGFRPPEAGPPGPGPCRAGPRPRRHGERAGERVARAGAAMAGGGGGGWTAAL